MSDEPSAGMLSRIAGILNALYWLPTSGKVRGDMLSRVEAWETCYGKSGLSFGRSKDEAQHLRDLTRDGLIESVGGRTKASSFRLTWPGMLAALPGDGVSARDIVSDLAALAGMQERSKITLPGLPGRSIVMAWELCPAAGKWFAGYDKSFARYSAQLSETERTLWPMLEMQWVRRFTDAFGVLWAVEVTDAGRDALASQQDLTIPTGTAYQNDAWLTGWQWGLAHFTGARPPPWTDSILHRRLPASAWC